MNSLDIKPVCWYCNLMSNVLATLTVEQLSELTGLILEKLGAMNLMNEKFPLTQYGHHRVAVLTDAYHILAKATDEKTQAPVVAPAPVVPTLTDATVHNKLVSSITELYPSISVHVDGTTVQAIRAALQAESKIQAIKHLRNMDTTAFGLKEAKDIIERAMVKLGFPKPLTWKEEDTARQIIWTAIQLFIPTGQRPTVLTDRTVGKLVFYTTFAKDMNMVRTVLMSEMGLTPSQTHDVADNLMVTLPAKFS